MKLRFVITAIATMLIGASHAIPVQKLTLKNGTVLEGFISMQRPGSSVQFLAERAEIVIDGTSVREIRSESVNYDNLSPAWKKWAEDNDAYEGDGTNRTLMLHNVIMQNGSVNNVKVLDRGVRVKYLELSPNTHTLPWDSVLSVQYDRRARNVINGVNRVYTLKDGTSYEGQYVEEVPGKTVSILDANGYVDVFRTEDILKFTLKKVNATQDLFVQSPLVDVVVLKNNAPHRGVIVEQNYNNDSNYLLLQSENGSTESLAFSDIVEYRKEVNSKYEPLYDILLKDGELVINRQKVSVTPAIEQNDFMVVDLDSCRTTIDYLSPVTEVVVEANLQNVGLAQQYNMVKVTDKTVKKKKYQGFSFEDIVRRSIRPISVTTSANNTTKIVYQVPERGYYVIYDDQKKSTIIFQVK